MYSEFIQYSVVDISRIVDIICTDFTIDVYSAFMQSYLVVRGQVVLAFWCCSCYVPCQDIILLNIFNW